MTFTPNPAFEHDVQREAAWQSFALGKAETAAQHATGLKPHRGSFKAVTYGATSTAAGVRVELGGGFWHLVEYGTASHAPWAPARHGIEAAGMTFRDSR